LAAIQANVAGTAAIWLTAFDAEIRDRKSGGDDGQSKSLTKIGQLRRVLAVRRDTSGWRPAHGPRHSFGRRNSGSCQYVHVNAGKPMTRSFWTEEIQRRHCKLLGRPFDTPHP